MLTRIITRGYAAKPQATVSAGAGITGLGKKKAVVKTGPTLTKTVLPVETDPHKLVAYCCGSCITKKGEDIKLGEDSEYPEWLWKMNTGKAPPLEELEYDTREFWYRIRKIGLANNLRLLRLRRYH